jgi:predicted ATPase
MLKSVRMRNFFGFVDATVELNPNVNALIGINGSGKSTFIKALRVLPACTRTDGLKDLILRQWGGVTSIANKRTNGTADDSVTIDFTFDGKQMPSRIWEFHGEVRFSLEITFTAGLQSYSLKETVDCIFPDGKLNPYIGFTNGRGFVFGRNEGEYEPRKVQYSNTDSQESILSQIQDSDRFRIQYALREAFSQVYCYDYFNTTPTSEIRRPALSTIARVLSPTGDNLPQLINAMKLNHRVEYNALKALLTEVNPFFEDIEFNHVGPNIELMLVEKELNSAIHVSQISDGTLHFLCLLAILYNSERGAIVAIDEPETGLHPDMMHGVAKAFREASEQTQFIITTHSAEFLEFLNLNEILVTEKDAGNATIIIRIDEDRFANWKADYSTGRLWQDGDLGGKRW